jgi:hypothetical protein
MASPILPTPTLRGKDAITFLEEMWEEQRNPDPRRVKFIEEAMKTKFNFVE